MTSHIVEEIQAVVDRLHSEGHTVATRLENALGHLKNHFKHDSKQVVADAEAAVAPVVAEVKADVVDAKAELEKDLAEPGDVPAITAKK